MSFLYWELVFLLFFFLLPLDLEIRISHTKYLLPQSKLWSQGFYFLRLQKRKGFGKPTGTILLQEVPGKEKNCSNHISTAESSALRHSLVHPCPGNSLEVEPHVHMSFSNASDEGQGVRATETAKK